MDVMLRFAVRSPELEAAFENAGYQVIVPTRREKIARPKGFQVCAGHVESDFSKCVAEIETFLQRFGVQIGSFQRRQVPHGFVELDFGIDCEGLGPVVNHRFSPQLLAQLAELSITLNVTTYA